MTESESVALPLGYTPIKAYLLYVKVVDMSNNLSKFWLSILIASCCAKTLAKNGCRCYTVFTNEFFGAWRNSTPIVQPMNASILRRAGEIPVPTVKVRTRKEFVVYLRHFAPFIF